LVEEQVCTQAQELDPAALQVKIICDPAEFYGIGSQWDRLVARARTSHPFLSHTWLRTWWEAFGHASQLFIVTIWAESELVAAAPMQRKQTKLFFVPFDTIASIYNWHTPRFDFILAADAPREILHKLIWNSLSEAGCDVVLLQQVPADSNTLASLEMLAAQDRWAAGRWSARPSPYIPLGCTHGQVLSRIKGSHRYNLRKRHERLSKLGPVDVEVITETAAIQEAIKDGLRIEAAAWKGDEGTAILSNPDVTAFYTRLAEREADAKNLKLLFLRLGGKRIAFSYLIYSQDTLYPVKIGYDPEYHTYSPGNMLLNLILQEACANGYKEYDFLGSDDEWKYDWTKEIRAHEWLFLFSNRMRPRLLHWLKFSLFPRVKQCISRSCPALARRTS
jgi:CelD/BcsL family acetyltransferase involved in cellulose biosynthesis